MELPEKTTAKDRVACKPDYPSSSSMFIVKNNSNPTVDKDVTASSSSINLFNMLNASDGIPDLSLSQENTENIETQTKQVRHLARDKTPRKLDKFPQQHRVKVRSPKQRAPTLDSQNNIQPQSNNITTCSVGMDAIDWGTEVEICVHNSENIEEIEDEERQSDHSLDDMCRICHGGDGLSQELGPLISACACRGTVGRVHVKCLERWLTESGKSRCELCGMKYTTRRVHRYGVPRALDLT
ncbi:E3 ubiquitin-protein ligase MARCH3 [Operophtera brumata]|uniref:E3 ubiquitin-protein ligase MARCH3 n=1 Tax=Operophtera brumata TaxID=104452 RepID=A0A0L7L986_OPEBR|nr:E3 ubiquitin-protein ligase MARCH3 [Operophtera brumata]